MHIGHLAFRPFFTFSPFFPPFSRRLLLLFTSIFTPRLHVYPCMLLINAYCPSFFQSLSSLLSLCPPFFPSRLNIPSHSSNKCTLIMFLSVTFLTLLALFPPFFVAVYTFFRQFYAAFNVTLQPSNKCILPTFLSVTFRAFSAFFRRFLSFFCNFYVAFRPSLAFL
jgi:hypothetical protein